MSKLYLKIVSFCINICLNSHIICGTWQQTSKGRALYSRLLATFVFWETAFFLVLDEIEGPIGINAYEDNSEHLAWWWRSWPPSRGVIFIAFHAHCPNACPEPQCSSNFCWLGEPGSTFAHIDGHRGGGGQRRCVALCVVCGPLNVGLDWWLVGGCLGRQPN